MQAMIVPMWMIRLAALLKAECQRLREVLATDDQIQVTGKHMHLSRQQIQYMAEQDANKIRERIAECKSIDEAMYGIRPLIDRYRLDYGNTPQIRAAEASLRLELFTKENEIIESL